MRDDLREIFSEAALLVHFITSARDIPEARPMIVRAHKEIGDLVVEMQNLPPEEEPVEGNSSPSGIETQSPDLKRI